MTPAERAASHLMQECSELIQACSKFQMFGGSPFFNGVQYNNIRDMRSEFSDLVNRANELFNMIDREELEK